MRRKTVTISDIAAKIGCTPSAVSRALNDKPGIGEEMRSRIRLVAMDMGYVFKKNIGISVKGVNKSIGIVLTRENFLDDFFYRSVIHGVESVLNQKKLSFFLSIVEKNTSRDVLEHLRQMHPQGVLVFGLVDPKLLADILLAGIPMVLVDTVNLNFQADRLTVGNYRGSYDVARYLWQEGHRKIAFLGDPSFSHNILQRYQGCRDFVQEYGENLIPAEGIVHMDFTGAVRVDRELFDTLLANGEPPTALVCASDLIAFSVYSILQEKGLRIPQDISVVGFDNVEKGEWVNPALTSVHVPKFEMGKKAVKMLLERIEDPQASTCLLQIDTGLKIRNSVAKIKR